MQILRKVFSLLLDIAETLILSAVFFFIVYLFLLRPFQVDGLSMYPTLNNKQYVLTNVIGLKFSLPKLGDVVVFKAPSNHEVDYIKRIMGVSGDRVMVKNGKVYLNGNPLDESKYLKSDVKTYGGTFLKEDQEITVPPNSYFAMGDNRRYSSDSREWGFVPSDFIIGFSFFAYWPIDEMRGINNPYNP